MKNGDVILFINFNKSHKLYQQFLQIHMTVVPGSRKPACNGIGSVSRSYITLQIFYLILGDSMKPCLLATTNGNFIHQNMSRVHFYHFIMQCTFSKQHVFILSSIDIYLTQLQFMDYQYYINVDTNNDQYYYFVI